MEAIRNLRETEPLEYERRMREYNLQLQGLSKAQIDKSNQPLPEEVIKSNWEGFTALLQGRALQPTTTDSANTRTTRRRKVYKGERESRRLANKPVEYGIFAKRKRSRVSVPKDL